MLAAHVCLQPECDSVRLNAQRPTDGSVGLPQLETRAGNTWLSCVHVAADGAVLVLTYTHTHAA